MMRNALGISAALAAALALGGCQSTSAGGNIAVASNQSANATMDHIMKSAESCWFGANASGFENYRLAPELTNVAGPPRILLVPASHPEGRPLAVVQAEGTPARVEAYGPLMNQPLGKRISSDVRRWAAGGSGCGASA